EQKPVEEKVVEEKPEVVEKLVEEKPVEQKPVDEKPVEEKVIEEKPVEQKPVEEKVVEEKPVQEKVVDEKPEQVVDTAPTENKEDEKKSETVEQPEAQPSVEISKQEEKFIEPQIPAEEAQRVEEPIVQAAEKEEEQKIEDVQPKVEDQPVFEQKTEEKQTEPLQETPTQIVEEVSDAVQPLTTMTVTEGDTVTLRIPDTKNVESNEIRVRVDDQLLPTDHHRITIEKDGTTDNYVVISDIDMNDAGRYFAEINGKLKPLSMIEVLPAEKPIIEELSSEITMEETKQTEDEIILSDEKQDDEDKSKPSDTELPVHEVVEGDTVNLTIERPKSSQITLFKDETKIEPSTRLSLQSISPTSTEITIKKVIPGDEGVYAVSFDKSDKKEKLMLLKVLPKPVIYDVLSLPKETFNEGEVLQIECIFDQDQDEDFVWLQNGEEIKPDDNKRIEKNGSTYTLIIKDLKPDLNEGVYTLKSPHLVLETPFVHVIAKKPEEQSIPEQMEELNLEVEAQKEGDSTETASQELQENTDELSAEIAKQSDEEIKEQPNDTLQDQQPVEAKEEEKLRPQPTFVQPLKANKTNLLEGEQLVFDCELDQKPSKVQLMKNGEVVDEQRIKDDTKDKKIRFTLDNLKLDESGDYTVIVNDDLESEPVSIVVNADIPKFVKNLKVNKTQLEASETIIFECELNKPYDEIVWLKDGEPIEANENVQITQDKTKLKLTIKNAKPQEDTGTYSVRVKDVESDKIPVTVNKKQLKFIKPLKANKTSLLEGEQLVFDCELDQKPSKVQLMKNGEVVDEQRIKDDTKDKKIRFTLDNVKLDESGDYTVIVNDDLESEPVSIVVNADIP
ncbi:unnamed protein product, partial [Didymodactylos carnosus]